MLSLLFLRKNDLQNFFNRTKLVLLETAEELVFGFDYAHPDRVQPKNKQSEPMQEKNSS